MYYADCFARDRWIGKSSKDSIGKTQRRWAVKQYNSYKITSLSDFQKSI